MYWGAREGFVTTQRTQLPGPVADTPTFADLNSDGQLDAILPSGVPAQHARGR